MIEETSPPLPERRKQTAFQEFLHAACGIAFGEERGGIEVVGGGGSIHYAGQICHEFVVADASRFHIGAGPAT